MAVHMNRPRARLRPGDLAEIRAADEILQTLDVDGTLDYLPFMPERVEFCGRRFRTPRPLSEFRRAGRWRIVPRVEFPGHREAHATHHLHAGDDRLERRPAPRARRLADRQARRDGDRAGVDDGVFTRVVRSRARERAWRSPGPHWPPPPAPCSPDQSALRRSAEALGGRARGPAEVVPRGGEAAPQRVSSASNPAFPTTGGGTSASAKSVTNRARRLAAELVTSAHLPGSPGARRGPRRGCARYSPRWRGHRCPAQRLRSS